MNTIQMNCDMRIIDDMNDLKISIIDPRSGEESWPCDDVYEMKNKRFCVEPLANQNLSRYVFEDGTYEFFTQPCMCFNTCDAMYKLNTKNIDSIFNNERFNSFRDKILHDNYSECHDCSLYARYFRLKDEYAYYNYAGLIHDYGYYGKQIYFAKKNKERAKSVPFYSLALNISSVCNLACKTCRTMKKTKEPPLTSEDFEKLLNNFKNFKMVKIGCDGETFYSKVYKDILSRDLTAYGLEKIEIFTNGTLMTQAALEKIHPNNWKIISIFRISIDAGKESSYKTVRDGRLWPRLLANIRNLNDEWKKKYGFKLASCFTVSKYNTSDIIDFIDLANELQFDFVYFSFAKTSFSGNGDESFVLSTEQQKNVLEELKFFLKDYERKTEILI